MERKMSLKVFVLVIAVIIEIFSNDVFILAKPAEDVNSRKEFICDSKPADVIFILDESNSIWRPHFDRQLKTFVQSIIETFLIGEENIRVGAITYSDVPFLQFGLKDYDSTETLLKAVGKVQQSGGYHTRTYDAIQYLREKGFSKAGGARDSVIKVGVVITDGRSDNTAKTIAQAQLAHLEGIHLFAIGVGYNIDENELRGIASAPNEHYTFMVSSYEGLDNIKETLAIKACQVTDPPTTSTTTPRPRLVFKTSPPKIMEIPPTTAGNQAFGLDRGSDDELDGRKGCVPKQPLDVAFIVDQKQGGTRNTRDLWKLIRETIARLNPEDSDIRISFIQECAEIPEIKLNDFYDKNQLLAHLDSLSEGFERTPGLLRSMVDTFREHAQSFDNLGRHRVAVYVTDGTSNALELTLREAQDAKLNEEVEIFGVGVTDNVSTTEMNALVSCEPEDHLLMAATHRDAHKLHKKLASKICKASPRHTKSKEVTLPRDEV